MSIETHTPEQIEALIQYEHDPGTRAVVDLDTESQVEVEVYVVAGDVAKAPVAA